MNALKNCLKYIIAPIIVLVVGGYSLHHFIKQDKSKEINSQDNSVIVNNMGVNNGVTNNTINATVGITNQGIQLITRPYQERITTLEQATTNQEEQFITLSKELTTTRKRLKQKQQEIDNLKLIISGVTFLKQPVTQLLLQDFDHTPWEQQLLLKVINDLMLEDLLHYPKTFDNFLKFLI